MIFGAEVRGLFSKRENPLTILGLVGVDRLGLFSCCKVDLFIYFNMTGKFRIFQADLLRTSLSCYLCKSIVTTIMTFLEFQRKFDQYSVCYLIDQ